jgi:glutamate synthase (NADPH/NADH) large chain
MIELHEKQTQSTVARAMLGKWESVVPAFIKVMPTDYKRALAEMFAQPAQAVEGL